MRAKFKLEKRELLYTLIGGIIILVWFLLIKDLIAPYLIILPNILSVLIYHTGFYIGIFLLSSILVSTKLKLKFSFIAISILTGIDLIDTPYMVSRLGILNTGVDYYFTTYDAGFYSIYSLFISGKLLWWLVYPITGILLILIIPVLISTPKRIWKTFMR